MAGRIEVSWAQLEVPDPDTSVPIQAGAPLGCSDADCGCAGCCGGPQKAEPPVVSSRPVPSGAKTLSNRNPGPNSPSGGPADSLMSLKIHPGVSDKVANPSATRQERPRTRTLTASGRTISALVLCPQTIGKFNWPVDSASTRRPRTPRGRYRPPTAGMLLAHDYRRATSCPEPGVAGTDCKNARTQARCAGSDPRRRR